MIKAVIFDYSGVVSSGGAGEGLSANLSKNLNITHDEASKLLHYPWKNLVRGNIDEDQFWLEVEGNYGQPISLNDRDIFVAWDVLRPRPEIQDFIKSLQTEGYITGLLSNVIASVSRSINENGGYELFTPCVLSHETGFAKPDPEIYQILLKNLPGIKPEEIIFIDDQEKCIPPAKAIGIKTIVATDPQEIIESIKLALAAA